jgi:hypothetical protein
MNETISFLVHTTGQGKIEVLRNARAGTNSYDDMVLYAAL